MDRMQQKNRRAKRRQVNISRKRRRYAGTRESRTHVRGGRY